MLNILNPATGWWDFVLIVGIYFSLEAINIFFCRMSSEISQ